MKTSIKNIFIFLSEIVLIAFVGSVLYIINTPNIFCLIIYLLLLLEIVLLFKKTYINCNNKLKCVAILSFVVLGIFYISMSIIKSNLVIPCVLATAYEFLMGFLVGNGFLIFSKLSKMKSNSITLAVIGTIVSALSFIVGLFALFGIAK